MKTMTPVRRETEFQPIRSPLRHLDTDEISASAKAESRNRELRLPPISVYRWWARRTDSVNGALVDAVAVDKRHRMLVSDPFAGGGVIPLAVIKRGHRVYAQDLNPWAAHGLHAMMNLPDGDALREGFAALQQRVSALSEAAYGTAMEDGTPGEVSHTFRVAVSECTVCGAAARLFPHAFVSLKVRAERGRDEAFLACPRGHVFEGSRAAPQLCPECTALTDPATNYTARRIVTCADCGHSEKLDHRAARAPLTWEVVLVERSTGRRRELALPRAGEISQANDPRWAPTKSLGPIPSGAETGVLLRHGFKEWEDLYPARQRWVTETLLRHVDGSSQDERTRKALVMAIVGTAEMAGLLSRWDRYYLKSYESMANHRFNFTTLTAEPNVWGTRASGRGTVRRRVARLLSAIDWRVQHDISETNQASLLDAEGTHRLSSSDEAAAMVVRGSSERQLLPDASCDLVLTDPPYHDDVQYEELSMPLRAWAGLTMDSSPASDVAVNPTVVRTEAQSDLLARIFRECRRTLRFDGHLIFSFANRDPRGWVELIRALHTAGYRTVGTEIIHSENESDLAKRNVRACTLDLILDLVPLGSAPVIPHTPSSVEGDEGSFLHLISSYVHRIGHLEEGWEAGFIAAASGHPFLTKRPTADPV